MSEKGVSRRKKTKSKVSLLLASLLLILAIGVMGSVSYLISRSETLTNTFTPGTVTPGVEEDFSDKTIKKNVKITNNGDVPVYIRATYAVSWVDSTDSSKVLPVTPKENTNYTISINTEKNDESGAQWIQSKVDGFYYYTLPVKPGESTDVLIKECTARPGVVDGSLCVDILTQSIQALPTTAVTDAWGVRIDTDGETLVVN